MPENGYVLALDFGLKYIGVAVGQTVTRTASGLTTLSAKDGIPDWSALLTLIREYRPLCIVVGLPLNMDDSESAMSARAREFGAELARRLPMPVNFIDERLTSVDAKNLLRESGSSTSGNHELAAAMIAESWLREHPALP